MGCEPARLMSIDIFPSFYDFKWAYGEHDARAGRQLLPPAAHRHLGEPLA
jgi:hypothetical protein